MTSFTLNGQPTSVDVDPSTPIPWVLRDTLHMTGTKFGCGVAQCGACTVHLNGQPVRSCVTPATAAASGKITTIEVVATECHRAPDRATLARAALQAGLSGGLRRSQIRRCARAGNCWRTCAMRAGSASAIARPSPSAHTASTSPQGPTTMLWPQVRRPFSCVPPCAAAST